MVRETTIAVTNSNIPLVLTNNTIIAISLTTILVVSCLLILTILLVSILIYCLVRVKKENQLLKSSQVLAYQRQRHAETLLNALNISSSTITTSAPDDSRVLVNPQYDEPQYENAIEMIKLDECPAYVKQSELTHTIEHL
jgi:hypothetical protein